MVIAGIPHEELRHTRAGQEWLAEGRHEGRQEGRQEGKAAVTLRLCSTAGAVRWVRPPAPASRRCRWSSWKRWRIPCSTSRAQMIWLAGLLSNGITPER